jgi:DNA-binding MarR family transcriptional regulator
MNPEVNEYMVLFTSFIERFTRGIESFQYQGKHIGTGIFLVNFIGKNPNCSMSDVKEFLRLIPSAATRRIDKLVNMGLVYRINDEKDRRLVKLILTEEGKELYQKFLQSRIYGIQLMKNEFSQEDLKVFFKILKRFVELKSKFPKDPEILKKL